MNTAAPMCRCGCGGLALWLMTGFDYEPGAKGGRGKGFVDEPACYDAAVYLEESSGQLCLPFSKRLAPGGYSRLFGSGER